MKVSDEKKSESKQEKEPKAEAPKAAEAKASKASKEKSESGKVQVKSLVNMLNLDGTHMVIGEPVELSVEEHARLSKDARGPFFE
jgi:hypothetical protein